MTPATAVAEAHNGTQPDIAAWPYRFEVVPLKHLVIDEYQRPLTTFVDKIEQHFNPALVGTLCVSERSKTKFAVIDGQTRAEGMRRHGLKEAPCLVFHGLSREQEAELFALFQTERRGMTSAARFRAQVIAKDPTAVAINEVVEGLGFVIDHNNNDLGALRAVAAVEYVFHGAMAGAKAKKTQNPQLLAQVLETIRAAWPKLPDTAKSATMIRGLGFYLANADKVDLERLANRLGKTTPSELAKRGEAVREGKGMTGNSPAYMAEAIESVYRRAR